LRDHISEISTQGESDLSSITFYADGRDDADRYKTFVEKSSHPVHFITGEYIGLDKDEGIKVKVNLADKKSEKFIHLKMNPGRDIILGCDGFNRYIFILNLFSAVRTNTLESENTRIDGLSVNYGGAFSYNFPGLSKMLIEPMENLEITVQPINHRLRVFRQRSDQLYLGVSLTKSEYEKIKGSKLPKRFSGFWEELHLMLKNYGLHIPGNFILFLIFSLCVIKPDQKN
jgi:hypothetical protein